MPANPFLPAPVPVSDAPVPAPEAAPAPEADHVVAHPGPPLEDPDPEAGVAPADGVGIECGATPALGQQAGVSSLSAKLSRSSRSPRKLHLRSPSLRVGW